METKPKGATFYVVMGLAVFIFVTILGAVFGSPEEPKQINTQAVVDDAEAAKSYYGRLQSLKTEALQYYNTAAKKAAAGDIRGAYTDFKGTAGQSVRGTTQILFTLKMKAPEGANQQLLKDAAQNLWLSFGQREDAVELFIEGVEKNSPGKFEEARIKSGKADAYLNSAQNYLEQISNRYGIKE